MLFDLLTTLHNLILRQIRSELLQDERTTEVEGELVASWLALLRKSATSDTHILIERRERTRESLLLELTVAGGDVHIHNAVIAAFSANALVRDALHWRTVPIAFVLITVAVRCHTDDCERKKEEQLHVVSRGRKERWCLNCQC